jgi:hypothetical protein
MNKKKIPDCCSKLFSDFKPDVETIKTMNEQCKKMTGQTCEEFLAQMGSSFKNISIKKEKNNE